MSKKQHHVRYVAFSTAVAGAVAVGSMVIAMPAGAMGISERGAAPIMQNTLISSNRLTMDMQLKAALEQHAALAGPTFQSVIAQSTTEPFMLNMVNANSNDIAVLIDTMYPGTQSSFLTLWNMHITDYMDYLKAAQANNPAGKMKAKYALASFADQISTWFVQHNSSYDKATLEQMFMMHGDQTTQLIDDLVQGNQLDASLVGQQAIAHMDMVADYLTQTGM